MSKGPGKMSRRDGLNADTADTLPKCASDCMPEDSEKTIADLREAVRARDDFIAFALHELRNPITPIQFSVDLVRAAQAQGDSLKLISELARLERLLNRFMRRTEVLLDVTQLVSGRLRLQPAQSRFSELAGGIIEDLKTLLLHSGSELTADIDQDLEGWADPMAFTQIFENLLSNAIKYGMGRPIEVRLGREGANARLTVRDKGLGIGAADRARIFEPFERAVVRNNQPGFGLGLWVTRRLVEAMDGSITVSSEKGEGSVFTVTLPLNPTKTDE